MTQFSWQPKAENLPTEFAAGWMLFLVCATGAQLGWQKALQYQNEFQKLEVHKTMKAAFQYRETSWLTTEPCHQGFSNLAAHVEVRLME